MEKAPEPEKLPEPGKGETAEKEANVDPAVQLKRRSETVTDEPKAKKGGIASATEKVKPIDLKLHQKFPRHLKENLSRVP